MIQKTSYSTIGYLYLLICCAASAYSFVFIADLNTTHNTMLSLILTFGYATILFTLFNIKKLPELWRLVIVNFKALFFLNLATLFSWLGTFVALKYIAPSTSIAIGFGLIAVTNFLIYTPFKQFKSNSHLVLCVSLILLSMVLIAWQYIHSATHLSNHDLFWGLFWSVLAGVIGGFVGINSEKLSHAGFSATQVLATRFYLIIIVAAGGFWLFPSSMPTHIDWHYYLLATLIVVIVPLFMYHIAIKELGSLLVSFVEPFTPVITFLLQITLLHYRFNLVSLLLLCLSSLTVMWLVSIEHRLAKQKVTGLTVDA